MPISEIDGCSKAHWEQVRAIIVEALSETDLVVELVSDADDVGVIQKRIIQNLYDNDIVVCDVSCKNPNVMFELGMRLAFDKPAVIIKDELTSYSFDTSPVEHLTYPRGLHYHAIQEFKAKLRSKVLATIEAAKKPSYTTFLKHFGSFVVATLEEKELGREEFILETLNELKAEVSKMRAEQSERRSAATDALRALQDRASSASKGPSGTASFLSNAHILVPPSGFPNLTPTGLSGFSSDSDAVLKASTLLPAKEIGLAFSA